MKIRKGTLLAVNHQRKGKFQGIATKDFDTEKDEWYPIAAAEPAESTATGTSWQPGEDVTCRNILCSVIVLEEAK